MASKRTKNLLYWWVVQEYASGNENPWYAESLYMSALQGVSDTILKSDRKYQELREKYGIRTLHLLGDPGISGHRHHADEIRSSIEGGGSDQECSNVGPVPGEKTGSREFESDLEALQLAVSMLNSCTDDEFDEDGWDSVWTLSEYLRRRERDGSDQRFSRQGSDVVPPGSGESEEVAIPG